MIKESDGGNTVMGIASWSPWHTDLARLFLLWDCWEDRKLLWTTLVPLWPALELVSTAEREEKPEERRGAVGIDMTRLGVCIMDLELKPKVWEMLLASGRL